MRRQTNFFFCDGEKIVTSYFFDIYGKILIHHKNWKAGNLGRLFLTFSVCGSLRVSAVNLLSCSSVS